MVTMKTVVADGRPEAFLIELDVARAFVISVQVS